MEYYQGEYLCVATQGKVIRVAFQLADTEDFERWSGPDKLRRWSYKFVATCGPFYKHGWTLIPAWLSNYIHCKVWDEITYPHLNSNDTTVEV